MEPANFCGSRLFGYMEANAFTTPEEKEEIPVNVFSAEKRPALNFFSVGKRKPTTEPVKRPLKRTNKRATKTVKPPKTAAVVRGVNGGKP